MDWWIITNWVIKSIVFFLMWHNWSRVDFNAAFRNWPGVIINGLNTLVFLVVWVVLMFRLD